MELRAGHLRNASCGTTNDRATRGRKSFDSNTITTVGLQDGRLMSQDRSVFPTFELVKVRRLGNGIIAHAMIVDKVHTKNDFRRKAHDGVEAMYQGTTQHHNRELKTTFDLKV